MSHNRISKSLASVLGPCLCAAGVGAAFAQQAPASEGPMLTVVVVTAEKVSENIEKAPLAITALTGNQIKAQGVFTATDLSDLVPDFTAAPNSNGSTIAIRGIFTNAQTLTGTPEVSYSVDGVSLLQKIDAFQGMFDVNRVEVLRGPQGTLYGADANAGAVNVITNKPDLTTTAAAASLSFGNYNAKQATAALNLPLSDTFGVRIAVDQDYHSGYISLLNSNHKFDDADYLGVRMHALWRPSSNFTALLTFEDSHDGGAGDSGAGSGAPLGLYAAETGAKPYAYQAMPAAPSQDWPIESATLNLNWSLPWAQVDFLSNVHWQDWSFAQPETIYGPDASYCQNTDLPTECHDPGYVDDNDRQDSDELRFSGQKGPVRWLVGLYHVRDVTFFNSLDYPSTFDPSEVELDVYHYTETQNAAYSQLTWNLTDQLALVGGLRYQRDVKDEPAGVGSGEYDLPIASIIPPYTCVGTCPIANPYSGYGKWSKVQWHAGVNYNITPSSMLFVSVATGYKAGGFNTGRSEPFNPTYGPENLTDYELGWKAQLLNHRAQINVDAFYMPYKDYQETTSLILPDGHYQPIVLNTGTAEIKGVELESTFLLTANDELSFYATALRAIFTNFNLPLGDGYCVGGGHCDTDYTDNLLPYAPTTTERLAYEHTFTLSDDDTLIAHLESNYSANYYLDYHNYNSVDQRAYTRSNAWITWERHRDNKVFSAQLFIRNIENQAILAGGQADSAAPNYDFNQYGKNGYYLPPRTYGVQFSVSF